MSPPLHKTTLTTGSLTTVTQHLEYVECWMFVVLADPDVEEDADAERVCALLRALEVERRRGRGVDHWSRRHRSAVGGATTRHHPAAAELIRQEICERPAGEVIDCLVDVHTGRVVGRSLALC